jgi:hypothetical protein
MNVREAIKLSINCGDAVSMGYLSDLTDQELLHRPCKGCNHINWQLGHLIASENDMVNQSRPGSMPPLPAGFAEKYTNDTATLDDPQKFCTKAELMAAYKQQRAAALAELEKISDAQFDDPSGLDYAPTVGAVMSMLGSHALMHAGQWAVVRRQLGRKPLF